MISCCSERNCLVSVMSVSKANTYLTRPLLLWNALTLAAIQISSQKEKYLQNDTVKGWLRSYIGLYSYVYLLTDEFDGTKDASFRFELRPEGTPSVGSALLRYIFGIPHLLIISLSLIHI